MRTCLTRLTRLDQAKSAVLNSLSSIDAQRGYRHAIEEFVEWYCSEPRLSFSKTVVLRYRIHLESRHLNSEPQPSGCVEEPRGRSHCSTVRARPTTPANGNQKGGT